MTETESIFCQAIAMTSLLGELSSRNFLNSEYYHNIHFPANDDYFKTILKASGLGNPATMQMFLYVLLVMPKEILKNANEEYVKECTSEFNAACKKLITDSALETAVHTNYPSESETDLDTIKFYRHIRNAVSHSICTYETKDSTCYVTFGDVDSKHNCECKFTFRTGDVGKLLELLQTQIMVFLNDKIADK